MIDTLKRL
jgi:hypothetical protein